MDSRSGHSVSQTQSCRHFPRSARTEHWPSYKVSYHLTCSVTSKKKKTTSITMKKVHSLLNLELKTWLIFNAVGAQNTFSRDIELLQQETFMNDTTNIDFYIIFKRRRNMFGCG